MAVAVTTTKTGFDSTNDNVSSANMSTFANSVDTIFNNILNGIQAADKLLFTSPATLTISGGVLQAPTQALHYISAETGVVDTLDTIGASNNRFVVLKATAGHTITLSVAGNMTTLDGRSITLTGNVLAMAWCSGSQWGLIGSGGIQNHFTEAADPNNYYDSSNGYEIGSQWVNTGTDRAFILVDATPSNAIWKRITPWKNSYRYRAAAATVLSIGVDVPTIANTPANANDANAPFVTLPTTAVSGNIGGFKSASFNLTRPAHDPVIEFLIKTDATITSLRVWIGLASADVTNADTLAAGTKFIGFRFSTIAGDAGWTPVNNNGTTQAAGATIGTVQASTVYKLRIRIVSGTPMAFFSVNDGIETAFATNLPAISTDMGIICRPITQAAAIRLINFSYCEVGW